MAAPSLTVGKLRKAAFAREAALSSTYPFATFVAPNLFPRIRPPASLYLKTTPLESPAIGNYPFFPFAVAPGPEQVDGAAVAFECDASPELWNLLFAAFGKDTVTDNLDGTWTHALERDRIALMPTYSWQVDTLNKQLAIIGAMQDSIDFTINAGELVAVETNWKGLGYKPVDPGTFTFSPTTAHVPQSAFRAKVTLGGSVVPYIRSGRLSLKNNVMFEHTVQQDTRQPSRIFSQGMSAEVALDAIWEDTVEYDKFTAQSDSSLTVEFLAHEVIGITVIKHKVTMRFPVVRWKSADLPLVDGLLTLSLAGIVKANQTVGNAAFGQGVFCDILNGDVAPLV